MEILWQDGQQRIVSILNDEGSQSVVLLANKQDSFGNGYLEKITEANFYWRKPILKALEELQACKNEISEKIIG